MNDDDIEFGEWKPDRPGLNPVALGLDDTLGLDEGLEHIEVEAPYRIFVGYDHRQPVSYHTLCHSIIKRTSRPVSIAPLKLETLPITRAGLTPFTFSRFLVPWLCDYKGWGLFLDADIVVLDDIARLFSYADPNKAVMVSQSEIQFEWASVIMFNNARCRKLTPEYVQTTGDGLHRMQFVEPELVGDLPREWNHLIGYDKPMEGAKLAHYTMGIPAFPEVEGMGYEEEWITDAQEAMSAEPWLELMGPSVHAEHVYVRLIASGRMKDEELQAIVDAGKCHPDIAARVRQRAAEEVNAPQAD